MKQYDYIRTAHRVYEKSIKEIAKETGHSKNTVKKVLNNELTDYKKRENQRYPKLGFYVELIDSWLLEDKNQPKKQRHTAIRIYNRLKNEHGYSGSDRTVRHYVRQAKVRLGLFDRNAFIPSDPNVGHEAEVDWGRAKAVINGKQVTVKFFCMRSKYSGKHFVRCYCCERQQALFDAHIHAFAYFRGVFKILIYDNMTTAVQKILRGKNRLFQEEFAKFKAYYSFTPRFCNPAKAHEKGGVEGIVGYVRRNYLVPIPNAESMEALNEKLLQECINHGDHRISGREKTVNENFEEEKNHLLSLPEYPYSNIIPLKGKLDKYSTIKVENNRYSAPTYYNGFAVDVQLSVARVEIYCSRKLIASHKRSYKRGLWVLEPGHYLKLIQQRPQSFDTARPIKQWRSSWPACLEKLRDRFCSKQDYSVGIKDFIEVLMLYDKHDKDDVVSAVELALENGISDSKGVKQILYYFSKNSEEYPPPLSAWDSVEPPDISLYGVLGGVS